MTSLLTAALTKNSLRLYQRAWQSLNEMCLSLGINLQLPVPMQSIPLFVAYLFDKGISPKTISTYLSAISYVHKLQNVTDPTKGFLVQKLIAGAQRLSPSFDVRLPITEPLLIKLEQALACTVRSYYDKKLFRAVIVLAFYAFARVGELTIRNKEERDTILQFSDLSFGSKLRYEVVAQITFRRFKHNITGREHTITLMSSSNRLSPVRVLQEYLSLRGHAAGPLFMTSRGQPVTRGRFDKVLRSALNFCNLDTARYKGHSFRIGAASLASERGFSDSQIRSMGRWKSEAFKRYIRAPPL